jgi:hypothetical protein
MVSHSIIYCDGFKYQLREAYSCVTPIVGVEIMDREFYLQEDGTLTIFPGFAWDGASGPTFDSKSSMRASLVHDVFCVCMRDGRLDYEKYQDTVNSFFEQQCLEDGMWAWRAHLWHAAVEFADAGNPNQGPDRKVLKAP